MKCQIPEKPTQRPMKTKTAVTKLVNNKLNVNNNIMIETNNYLNYIEINEGTLDLIIKFPSGSKVSMTEGKTKRVLQPNDCQCTRRRI